MKTLASHHSLPLGRLMAGLSALLCLAVSLPLSEAALAQCRGSEQDKLTAVDGMPGSTLGKVVALDGAFAVVGAEGDDELAPLAGAAYVFRQVGGVWAQEQKLTASDASEAGVFGTSVDIRGDRVIVGSFEHSGAGLVTGAAYIFRHDGSSWIEEQKLTLPDAGPGDRFGSSVAVDGDVAVVGADSRTVGVNVTGAAYVYRFDGSSWLLEATLTAHDANDRAFFGSSVSLESGVAVVGADADNILGVQAGAAYVFRDLGGSWVEEQKLNSSDGVAGDLFGTAVAVEAGLAVVTALHHDELGANRGAAYVFRDVGGSWLEETKLVASDVEPFDRFGRAVSMSGDTVLVGSDDDDFGNVAGAAYLYRYNGVAWVEQVKLTATTLAQEHHFGSGLAIDGTNAIVGASGDSELGAVAGAAYAFEIPGLTLDISQESAAAGETLDIQGCGGVADNPIGFAAVEFAGDPIQLIFDLGTVDANGTWSTTLQIPDNPTLPGNTAGFEMLTIDRLGSVVRSNRDTVAFE